MLLAQKIKTSPWFPFVGELPQFFAKKQLQNKWVMLFLAMFVYVFYYTGRQNYGFAILGIQQSLGLDTIQTGIISGTLLFTYGIGQAINGAFGDKYSAKLMITIGALASCVLNYFMSFSSGFWMLLLLMAANGYAQSFGFAPGTRLLANWWPEKERGKAFGWFLFSSGLSSVITYALCIVVLSYFTWEYLFRLPTLALAVAAIIFYLFAKDAPKEDHYIAAIQSQVDTSQGPSYLTLLTNPTFLLAAIAMGFSNFARYGLIVWMPAFFVHQSASAGMSAAWVSLGLPLGMSFGSVICGHVSDKYFDGHRGKPAMWFLLSATLLVLLIGVIDNKILEFIILFAAGLLIYGAQTPLFALCPELLGREATSKTVGTMNAFAYGFAAVGEAIIGYAIQHSGNDYTVIFYIVAATCLLGGLCAAFIKR